ncbi:tetratricopeptide repeat protein [Thiohalorhabdus sp.]|uniref:tetratricopeptide repeat protein n=1 Tax=Thiohalorhabdus sp. TaxID=3094134 RepID=UPI002FC2B1A3
MPSNPVGRIPNGALLGACLLLALPAGGPERTEADTLAARVEAAWSAGEWPTAEKRLKRLHKRNPGNAETLRRWGLAAAYQGGYDRALRRLRQAREISPRNTDILLGLARVHVWRGARNLAVDQVAAVLAREPELAEAHALRGQLAYYRGDLDAAEDYYRTALAKEPGSESAQQGLEQIRQARADHTPWRFDVGHSRSRVYIGDATLSWQATEIAIAHTFGGPGADRSGTLTARLHQAERAGTSGRQVSVGGVWPLSQRGRLRGEVGVAGGADFLPRSYWRLGGNLRLRGGSDSVGPTALDAYVSHRRYADGDTWLLAPALEQAFWDGPAGPRLKTTLRLLTVRGSDANWDTGYALRLDGRLYPDWQAYAGYSVAYETDETYDADGNVVGFRTSEVRTAFAGLGWQFTDRQQLECGLTYQEREHAASWQREAWRCGLTWQH